jgi:hypothetical protein
LSLALRVVESIERKHENTTINHRATAETKALRRAVRQKKLLISISLSSGAIIKQANDQSGMNW